MRPGANGEQLRSPLGRLKDSLNVPASLVATGVACVALNAAIYIPGWGEDTIPGKLKDVGTVENTTTWDQVVGRSTHTFRKHTSDKQALESTSGSTQFDINSGSQVYAEEFADDPRVGEFTDPKSFDDLVDGIRQIVNDDAEIKSITLTGYSSAEDDNPDGGLTTPSEKNQQLAQKRAKTVADQLRDRLDQDPELANATKDVHFVFGESTEQGLNPYQDNMVEKRAKQAGFSSAKELVEAWNNDPSSVGAADKKFLNDLLAVNRKVTADITWRKQGKDIYEVSDFCTRFIVTNVKTQERKDKDHIPVVPYIIPIPIFRRRKKARQGSAKESAQAEQAVVSTASVSEEKLPPEAQVQTVDEPSEVDPMDDLAEKAYERGYSRGLGLPPSRFQKLRGLLGRGSRVPEPRPLYDREPTRGEKIANRLAAGTLLGFLGLLACVNISGKNCKGAEHLPRPFLIDAVWEIVDDATDRGADVSQQFSIGVPFVDSLQINLGDEQPGSMWVYDPARPCREDNKTPADGPSTGTGEGVPAPPPRCSVVTITKRDGTVIARNTIYQAGPTSTRTVVEKTK